MKEDNVALSDRRLAIGGKRVPRRVSLCQLAGPPTSCASFLAYRLSPIRARSALAAEATLAWRRAVRGPFLWAILAALGLLLIALPGVEDPELLRTPYALGLAWALLLIAALWTGANAYALDRDRELLALPLVKPLRPVQLWLARLAANLLPFAVAVAAVGALLVWRGLPPGRERLAPTLPPIAERAEAEFARFEAEGRLPAGVPRWRLLRAFREELENRYTELKSGEPQRFTFALPATLRPGAAAFRLSGAPFLGAKESLRLSVTATCAGESRTVTPGDLRDNGFTLSLGEDLLRPGQPLTLTLARTDTADVASVLYREYCDLALLLPGCSAPVNLLCFCAALLGSCAMALALGMALGCVLSLPVSLFTGTLALLALTSATLAPGTTVADEQASRFGRLASPISQAIAQPLRPLVALNPLVRLFEGLAITPRELLAFGLRTLLPWLLICAIPALSSAARQTQRS